MKLEEVIDIGEDVMCDICSDDYTNSDENGGFLFGSKAVCPKCAPRIMEGIEKYNEQSHIKGYCPKDMSFRAWCLELRGGNNTIRIYTQNGHQ